MAELPDRLERVTNVELSGRDLARWYRRLALLLLAGVLAAALAGVFGQRPGRAAAEGPGVQLALEVPRAVRSGLMYQALFRIETARPIAVPALVLEDGWFETTTVNSLEPAPTTESENNGHMVFTFGRLEAGESLSVRMQLQANPTSVGSRSLDVALNDGGEELARIDRSLTIYP